MPGRCPLLLAIAILALGPAAGCGGEGADEEEDKPLSRTRCSDIDAEGDLGKDYEHWSGLSLEQKLSLSNLYQVGRGGIEAASPDRVLSKERFDDQRLVTVVDRYYERGARCNLANAFAAADRKLILFTLKPRQEQP